MADQLAKRHADKSLDKIIAYLKSDAQTPDGILTEKEAMYMDHLNYADDQIRKHRKLSEVANLLMKKVNCKKAWAYKIIRDTQVAHATSSKFVKDYYTGIGLDMVMEVYNMAKMKKDVRGMNAAVKNMITMLKLDQEENEGVPPNLIENLTMIFSTDPSMLGSTPPSEAELRARIVDITPEDA